jgi:hypothetical protein
MISENLKPVEISKNHFNVIQTSSKVVLIFKISVACPWLIIHLPKIWSTLLLKVKFGRSEKATKISNNLPFDLTFTN